MTVARRSSLSVARARRRSAGVLLVACVLVGLSACEGDSDSEPGPPGQDDAARGGRLTVLASYDVDYLDPGRRAYYAFAWATTYATQRPLYSYLPDDPDHAQPDLADGPPEISEDARTVTVHLKSGVRFSPPVDREVTSSDVKYAIERGFFDSVETGYLGLYFADIQGAELGVEPGTALDEGIETPDDRTIVFHLARPSGGLLAAALALPVSAPVPEEYAAPFDDRKESRYGDHVVATGPYMVENDEVGRAIGYQPEVRIHLVRNPNWDPSTDFRPAYVDEIVIDEGNDDPPVAPSRRILRGHGLVSGDFKPVPGVLQKALRSAPDQVAFVPGGGTRYVSMNTKIEPFDDINLRKAVSAGFDRAALREVRGGEIAGDIATHALPPGISGFEEAGGEVGPGVDFLADPHGDMDLAAEYFRKAGYASGRYEGDEPILMVGADDNGVGEATARRVKANFEKLGFKVRLRLEPFDVMYQEFCSPPGTSAAVCSNVGWFKDFSDGQTILDPAFNGDKIEFGNNYAHLDVPAINLAMKEAAGLSDPQARAEAWGAVDRQVTEQAAVVPYLWDMVPLLASADVAAVPDEFLGQWSYSFSSLRHPNVDGTP